MLNCKLSHSLVYLRTNCIAYIVYIIVYTRSLFRFRFVCFPFLSHCATRYSELSRTKASARFTSLQYGLFLFLFIKYILLSSLPVIFWSNHFAICSLIHLQNFLFSSWESIVYPRTNSPFSLQFFRNSPIRVSNPRNCFWNSVSIGIREVCAIIWWNFVQKKKKKLEKTYATLIKN